jgi:hypothetical protein
VLEEGRQCAPLRRGGTAWVMRADHGRGDRVIDRSTDFGRVRRRGRRENAKAGETIDRGVTWQTLRQQSRRRAAACSLNLIPSCLPDGELFGPLSDLVLLFADPSRRAAFGVSAVVLLSVGAAFPMPRLPHSADRRLPRTQDHPDLRQPLNPPRRRRQGMVAGHAERIELVFLPAYSPHLNPDETSTRTSRDTSARCTSGPAANPDSRTRSPASSGCAPASRRSFVATSTRARAIRPMTNNFHAISPGTTSRPR